MSDTDVGSHLLNRPCARSDVSGDGSSVLLVNTDDNGSYVLMNGRSYTLFDSMEIYSGPNNPFEYVVIRIPTRRMVSYNTGLYDVKRDVINVRAGKSLLYIGFTNTVRDGATGTDVERDSLKTGTYTVSKVKQSGGTYTITAYCTTEVVRSMTCSPFAGNPWVVLRSLCAQCTPFWNYYGFRPDDVRATGTVEFNEDTNLWMAVQVCATMLGMVVFFTAEGGHLVRYGKDVAGAVNPLRIKEFTVECEDYTIRKEGSDWTFRIPVNTNQVATLSDDTDSVVNRVTANYTTRDGTTSKFVYTSPVLYKDKPHEVSVNLPLVTRESVEMFCKGYVRYTQLPSVGLNVTVFGGRHSEVVEGGGTSHVLHWVQDIPLVSYVTGDGVICNENDQSYRPEALNGGADAFTGYILTEVVLRYPTMSVEYTFGNHRPVTLDNTVSQIASR